MSTQEHIHVQTHTHTNMQTEGGGEGYFQTHIGGNFMLLHSRCISDLCEIMGFGYETGNVSREAGIYV